MTLLSVWIGYNDIIKAHEAMRIDKRDDMLEAVISDVLLGFYSDVARVDGEHAFCTRSGCK